MSDFPVDRFRPQFERCLQRFAAARATPVALYGAGRFVRDLRPLFGTPPGLISYVIDDDASKHGKTWCGLEVVSLAQAADRGVKGVLLTAYPPAQDAMWARRGALRDAGMYVLTCPARFEARPWDECLIDQMEATMAAAAGGNPLHIHAYPPVSHRAPAGLRELCLGAVPDKGVVCEIGPGTGFLTEFLAPRAGRYYAVDYSAALLWEALEHRMWAHRDRLTLLHDEAASLAGVPDGAVDAVVSFDVFVHIKIDVVHQFLRAIRRVLKPSGSALIHFVKWDDRSVRDFERLDLPAYTGRPNYLQYLHDDQLAESCRRHGLRLETFQNPTADHRWFMRVRPG